MALNDNERPAKLKSLQDLQQLLDSPPPAEGTAEVAPRYTDRYNNTYDLVALMMYLMGVEETRFTTHDPDLSEHFNKYEKREPAKIIRNLCRVRTALMQNFIRIVNAFKQDLVNLASIPDLVPSESVNYLEYLRINIQKSRPNAMEYIITINKEVSNRINNVKSYFPDWVNWDYIRPLFIMPNGMKPDGVKAAADYYNSDRNRYPYQCWMEWSRSGVGNIFFSDYKFVTLLYESHEDYFENRSLVTAAGDILLGNLNDFLEDHERTLIVVDCENSDPIKLAAALSSLPPMQKDAIHKVMLFDSDYTTSAWTTLCNTGITREFTFERIVVERLYEHKSLVDMRLAVNTTQEILLNHVDSVILISSDSDYWALIRSLPDTDFMVMLEKMKSGQTIRDALEQEGYTYCFIDDFCTAASYTIKTRTIQHAIQTQLDEMVHFNAREMLNNVMKSTWLEMTEKEKENFYDRHLKNMRLVIDKEGNASIQLG